MADIKQKPNAGVASALAASAKPSIPTSPSAFTTIPKGTGSESLSKEPLNSDTPGPTSSNISTTTTKIFGSAKVTEATPALSTFGSINTFKPSFNPALGLQDIQKSSSAPNNLGNATTSGPATSPNPTSRSSTPAVFGSAVTMTPSAAPTQKLKKRLNFSAPQTFVTIIVDKGSAKTTHVIPKQFTDFYSPFLEAAFSADKLEGKTKTMFLEEVDAATFGIFVHWLYTQKIETSSGTVFDFPSQLELGKLWMLAQRFKIPRSQNEIMTILKVRGLSFIQANISKEFLEFAYSRDGEDNPLKRFAVDSVLANFQTHNLNETMKMIPEKMLRDFGRELATLNLGKVQGEGFGGRTLGRSLSYYDVNIESD